MAQKLVVTDDLTGEVNANAHTFSIDNTTYAIDLSDKSFNELKNVLKPFIAVARPATSTTTATTTAAASAQPGTADTPVRRGPGRPKGSGKKKTTEPAGAVSNPFVVPETKPARAGKKTTKRRKATVLSGSKRTPKRTHVQADPSTVRAWARNKGMECPLVGRIPNAVIEAFNEANPA